VGDIYYKPNGEPEGVVWWIADTTITIDTFYYGQHGKLISKFSGGDCALQWGLGPAPSAAYYILAFDSLDGEINTDIIMQWKDTTTVDTIWARRVQAAPWCRSLGAEWYLPALKEAYAMFALTVNVINPVLATIPNADTITTKVLVCTRYWTSTAVYPYNGHTYLVGIGNDPDYNVHNNLIMSTFEQQQSYGVRAVRKF
jgi:hypothetical protein